MTLDRVKSQGYTALVNVGQQGLNFAVQKAITVSQLLLLVSSHCSNSFGYSMHFLILTGI